MIKPIIAASTDETSHFCSATPLTTATIDSPKTMMVNSPMRSGTWDILGGIRATNRPAVKGVVRSTINPTAQSAKRQGTGTKTETTHKAALILKPEIGRASGRE